MAGDIGNQVSLLIVGGGYCAPRRRQTVAKCGFGLLRLSPKTTPDKCADVWIVVLIAD